MKRGACIRRVDDNQAMIAAALRAAGASVQSLHTVGRGCPDLLVGYRGLNFLLEVKDGSKAPSRRRMTEDELEWVCTWRGEAIVVSSVHEALVAIGCEPMATVAGVIGSQHG